MYHEERSIDEINRLLFNDALSQNAPDGRSVCLFCAFCKNLMPSVEEAIAAGWEPCYYSDEDQQDGPVCPECASSRCHWEGNDLTLNHTLKQIAQDAVSVQSHPDMLFVSQLLSRAINDLYRLNPKMSTDELNTHPVCVVFVDKLRALTGSPDNSQIAEAFRYCQKLAEGE